MATAIKMSTTNANTTNNLLHHHYHHHTRLVDTSNLTNANTSSSTNTNASKALILSSSLSSCYSSSSSSASSSTSSSLSSVKLKANTKSKSLNNDSSPINMHEITDPIVSNQQAKSFTAYQYSLPVENSSTTKTNMINNKIPFRPINNSTNLNLLKQQQQQTNASMNSNNNDSTIVLMTPRNGVTDEAGASLLSLNKLERNYSYIEAMKEDSIQLQETNCFLNTNNISNTTSSTKNQQPTSNSNTASSILISGGGKLLVKANKSKTSKNKEKFIELFHNHISEEVVETNTNHTHHHLTFLKRNKKQSIKQMSLTSTSQSNNTTQTQKQSLSPLYSSSSTSTCSSTSSSTNLKPSTPSPPPPPETPTTPDKSSTIKTSSSSSTTNSSNLSKSKSQSSILNLFKNTFSPFSIRKWRSKSRDKLSHQEASLSSPPPTPQIDDSSQLFNTDQIDSSVSSSSRVESKYQKNPNNGIKVRVKSNKTNESSSKPINETLITSNDDHKLIINTENSSPDLVVNISSNKLNNLLNNSNFSTNTANKNDVIGMNMFKKESASASATPTTSIRHLLNHHHTNSTSSQSSPQTERQLSYLKLACFVNGYDSFSSSNNKLTTTTTTSATKLTSSNSLNHHQVKSSLNSKSSENDIYVGMKSFEILNTSERFYDLKKKTNFIKITTNSNSIELNETKNDDVVVLEEKKEKTIEQPPINITNETTTTTTTSNIPIQDGHYYINLLDKNTSDINELCRKYQEYVEPPHSEQINEDTLGQIQTTIGKAQLLINQKFKQFRGLCLKNISDKVETRILNEGEFITRDEDLAGFWDMVCLQIEDIHRMFTHLDELKSNNWQIQHPVKVVKKVAEKKKPPTATSTTDSSKPKPVSATKARADAARQRLIEAKKNAALLKQKQQEEVESQHEQQNVEIVTDSN